MSNDTAPLSRIGDAEDAATLLLFGLVGRQRTVAASVRRLIEGKAAGSRDLAAAKRAALDEASAMQQEVNALVAQIERLDIDALAAA